MKLRTFSIVLAACATAAVAANRTVTCPVTSDTWIAMASLDDPKAKQSDTTNHGLDLKLLIQGRDSLALFQFDTAGLKGRKIEKARLRMHRADADPVPLHTAGISTVSGTAPWLERECTFFFPRAGKQPWSYPDSDLIDVLFGQGNSLYSYERVRDGGGGWYEIDVSPQIVSALASGDQFGLALTDEKGQTHTVHEIESRESSHPPVLIVDTADAGKTVPGRVRTREIGSTPEEARKLGRATLPPGSVILSFGGAGERHEAASRYEVRYSEQPIDAANFDRARTVARWMLNPLAPKSNALANSNSLQDWVTAVVEELSPGAAYWFAARAVDTSGNAGPVSQLGRRRVWSRSFPSLPLSARKPPGGPLTPAGAPGPIRVWAVPELVKIHPRTGELREKDYPHHRAHNAVWDASTATVRLLGARNEFLGFQLAVESAVPVSGIEVGVSQPLFAGSALPPVFEKSGAVQLAREWFVPDGTGGWFADGLAPPGPLGIPSADNPVPGQTVAPVFVDVYVPHTAAPGKHTGELSVRGPGFEKRIRLEVEVLPLTLPDKLGFVVDLNCYSAVPAPATIQPGTPEYRALVRAYHRVAHLHRANLDVLGYSQGGATLPDQAPPLQGEGARTRVASWRDWDAHFGPMLSGSAFRDLPRAGVPVPAIYLPFFENWPGDLRKDYSFEQPERAGTVQEYEQLVTRHALNAAPIEEMFSRDYQERFTAVVSQFAGHIRERGWLATDYLVYFNNKYYFKRPNDETGGIGSSLWLLDEPNHRDDFRALSFFYGLTRRGLAGFRDVPVRIRSDISRVEWIRDTLAGQIDLNCVSKRLFEKNRYLTGDRNRFGRTLWNYASTNHPRETNVAMRAWCWRAWLSGADAVVPWNAAARNDAWKRAEQLTVFYAGDKFGQLEPFPSLRLKAYRRGQQDVEYLILLAGTKGWDREAVTAAVLKRLDLGGSITQSYEEDAGSVFFRNLQDSRLDELRLLLAGALSDGEVHQPK